MDCKKLFLDKEYLNFKGIDLDYKRLKELARKAGADDCGVADVYSSDNENLKGTVAIQDMVLEVQKGHQGQPDISIIADSRTWLGFLAKEKNLVFALVSRKIQAVKEIMCSSF